MSNDTTGAGVRGDEGGGASLSAVLKPPGLLLQHSEATFPQMSPFLEYFNDAKFIKVTETSPTACW